MEIRKAIIFIGILIISGCSITKQSQDYPVVEIDSLSIFPQLDSVKSDMPSPVISRDGREIIMAQLQNAMYCWFDATVENADTLNYKEKWDGKGMQLLSDNNDFPNLTRTGLHSERELRNTWTITGKSVSQITVDGRPGRSSGAGFMAADETIMSVIWADNKTVKKLGLTHPDLARPLFHLWNIGRLLEKQGSVYQLKGLVYNMHELNAILPENRGWQESIFNDEILGSYHIEVSRNLLPEEEEFLKDNYGHLSEKELNAFKQKLSFIHTGEMVPFYINRYGFYEGHTGYRGDPLSIAFVFGLRTIEEINQAADGDLYKYYTSHFTKNPPIQNTRPRIKSGAGSRPKNPPLSCEFASGGERLGVRQTENPQPAIWNLQPAQIDSLIIALKTAGSNWNGPSDRLVAIGDASVPALLDLLNDQSQSQWTRRVAAMTLNQLRSPLTVEPGLKFLFNKNEEWKLRNQLIPSLKGFDLSHVKTDLWVLFVETDNEYYQNNIAELLSTSDTALAYRAYEAIFYKHSYYVQQQALKNLVSLRPHESTQWYIKGIQIDEWMTANLAMDSLVSQDQFKPNLLVDIYYQKDIPEEVRWRIIYIFGNRQESEPVLLLEDALQDSSWLIHMEALVGRFL